MENSRRYYTPGQVALACFLGSPLAACWLMARTYLAAEEKKQARWSVICGMVGTATLLGIGFALPEGTRAGGLAAGITVGLYHIAKQLQASTIARCIAAGRAKGSWWVAAGIGVIGLVVVFAVVMGIFYFVPEE